MAVVGVAGGVSLSGKGSQELRSGLEETGYERLVNVVKGVKLVKVDFVATLSREEGVDVGFTSLGVLEKSTRLNSGNLVGAVDLSKGGKGSVVRTNHLGSVLDVVTLSEGVDGDRFEELVVEGHVSGEEDLVVSVRSSVVNLVLSKETEESGNELDLLLSNGSLLGSYILFAFLVFVGRCGCGLKLGRVRGKRVIEFFPDNLGGDPVFRGRGDRNGESCVVQLKHKRSGWRGLRAQPEEGGHSEAGGRVWGFERDLDSKSGGQEEEVISSKQGGLAYECIR